MRISRGKPGRCPPDAHALVVGDGTRDETSPNPSFAHGVVIEAHGSVSSSRCPASGVESLGAILYARFRRRYGLQRTAEERVAGLLGSIVEHSPASAVLRLFARMLGASADAQGGGGESFSTGTSPTVIFATFARENMNNILESACTRLPRLPASNKTPSPKRLAIYRLCPARNDLFTLHGVGAKRYAAPELNQVDGPCRRGRKTPRTAWSRSWRT